MEQMETVPVRAEVDLSALDHNIRQLKSLTSAAFMAVVKADAYGHGAVPVAGQALRSGADRLAVARVAEAVALRQAGIDAPILVLGETPLDQAPALFAHDLSQTVYSLKTAQALSEMAKGYGRCLAVHLKVDTGMGRVGIWHADPGAAEIAHTIAGLDGLVLEGVYTHFAAADSADKGFALQQLERFQAYLKAIAPLQVPFSHAANSAALMELPGSHLDMVRPGIALYGLYPSEEMDKTRVALQPVMRLKARIVQVKPVPAGFTVSYGATHVTRQPTTIATVSVGYADGLNRQLSNQGHMLVHGRRVPIVGRICMDLTMLDLGDMAGVRPGDEAVVFGRQGDAVLGADEIAARLETISYEVVSAITGRVPRYCIHGT